MKNLVDKLIEAICPRPPVDIKYYAYKDGKRYDFKTMEASDFFNRCYGSQIWTMIGGGR